MAAIVGATLQSVFPEWAQVPAATLAHAVGVANAMSFEAYTVDDEDTHRRYLEASAILFDSPYSRDLRKSNESQENYYRTQADQRDVIKGTSIARGVGWSIPSGAI